MMFSNKPESVTRKRFVDLSHTIKHDMITYEGLPPPIISDFMNREESKVHYAEGVAFHIAKIEMVANTGTYLDSPFHRYVEGPDVSELPLDVLADLEGIIIRATDRKSRAIDSSFFEGKSLKEKAVLIHTGWDCHWGTQQYFDGHPFLTKDAVELLISEGVALVGIDSLNIDDTADGSRPAHSLLLREGIPIVEHMSRLDQLPDQGFRFFAVPAPVKGLGTFPVRAFAILG